MPVILARHAYAGTEGGAVHAYRLPDREPEPAVWTAACGATVASVEVERVEQFTGAPCPTCLIAAFGQRSVVTAFSGNLAPGLGTYPVYTPVSPTGSYAVALYGERLVHWVADRSVCGQLDGRDVVQSVCGHLGWGPLDTPPRGWPTCGECRGVPS